MHSRRLKLYAHLWLHINWILYWYTKSAYSGAQEYETSFLKSGIFLFKYANKKF